MLKSYKPSSLHEEKSRNETTITCIHALNQVDLYQIGLDTDISKGSGKPYSMTWWTLPVLENDSFEELAYLPFRAVMW